MTSSENTANTTNYSAKDFLYSVLNLPRAASDNEIRERYRALSIVFHPDKQHDESTKETANRRFLEIQKAYEVLSDPFLRQVYDVLGYDGLSIDWPPQLRDMPRDQVRRILTQTTQQLKTHKLVDMINPQGQMTFGIDARSLFTSDIPTSGSTWVEQAADRVSDVRISSFVLQHTIQRSIDAKTQIAATAKMGRGAGGNVLGTVRHQYSPRLRFEATASLLRSRLLSVKGIYLGDDETITAQTSMSLQSPSSPPPLTVTYSRRLSRTSPIHGVLGLHAGEMPFFTLDIRCPSPFDLTSQIETGEESPRSSSSGSVSGLSKGLTYSSYGVTLAGLETGLRAQWGVTFSELQLETRLLLQLNVRGLSWALVGSWGDDQGGVSTSVEINTGGVEMKLDLTYLGQRLVVPVTVADDYDPSLGFLTAVLPTTGFLLAYQLILKPRRRKERAAFFRNARKELSEDRASVRREVEETISLLKETARKHMQAEKAREGLVILDAKYGPTDSDLEARSLEVDVTIPIQALVYHSQLYIPGHRTKSGLQGFYDPAPSCSKALRIRYSFLGRMHYAEIPDFVPVVLPLEDHLVNTALL